MTAAIALDFRLDALILQMEVGVWHGHGMEPHFEPVAVNGAELDAPDFRRRIRAT